MKKTALIAALVLIFSSNLSYGVPFFWSQGAARERLTEIFEQIELRGPQEKLVEELARFVESYPYASVTDEALIRLAGIHLRKKNFEKAGEYYQQILERFPRSRYKIDALYGLGYCQYRGGEMREAETALRSVSSSAEATLSMKVKARILSETIASVSSSLQSEPEEVAIGAVLPLKGVYATFGEAALKGILLAADVFANKYGPVEVKAMDMAGGESSIDWAIDTLSEDRRMLGLVGPLVSRTAGVVALKAQQKGLPIIVLSQKDGIPETGDYVFRNFLTPTQQAESIAGYAYKMLGKKKFAVLYPRNRYGVELSNHFKREVTELGGEIVNEISYSPEQKDFGEELEFLFDIEVKEHVKGRRHIREYTPTVEIEALYIPDYPEAVGQIAPYLAYYNIKDLQLLGSNGWNSPRLVELAGKYVEGAIFVDGFFSWSERPGTKQFIERFTEVYGHRPGLIEAQAYDATMMLVAAIRDGGESREGIRNNLDGSYGFEGATGTMQFNYTGEAVKNLFLLTVKKKKIVEIF
jgi:ABC-type branched-subunit amino acid transport system substrate-binding protein